MKPILSNKTGLLTIFAVLAVVTILTMQVYIIYNNYLLTRDYFVQEVNNTIADVYNKYLGERYSLLVGDTTILKLTRTLPEGVKDVVTTYKTNGLDGKGVLVAVNSAIGEHVNKNAPINLKIVDSLATLSLKDRGINSDLYILLKDSNDSIIDRCGEISENSFFTIISKNIPINSIKQESLQFILKNPQTDIFKRSMWLLSCSFILALFCIYGFYFMKKTLSDQSKLMIIKNDFFDQVAHELRRPISHIQMAVERLFRTAKPDEKSEQYLAIADESVKSMSSKLNMILALSMAKESVLNMRYARFDIIDMLKKLQFRFMEVSRKDVTIALDCSLSNILISADKEHLQQSIENLLDNAIKYSNDDISIILSAEKLGNDSVAISVKDNGIGIPNDKLENIFSKFSRENNNIDGFGIGLSYVEKIIEKHKGDILVESTLGKGSKFTIVLPL